MLVLKVENMTIFSGQPKKVYMMRLIHVKINTYFLLQKSQQCGASAVSNQRIFDLKLIVICHVRTATK
jgi:hypothetical protein